MSEMLIYLISNCWDCNFHNIYSIIFKADIAASYSLCFIETTIKSNKWGVTSLQITMPVDQRGIMTPLR